MSMRINKRGENHGPYEATPRATRVFAGQAAAGWPTFRCPKAASGGVVDGLSPHGVTDS